MSTRVSGQHRFRTAFSNCCLLHYKYMLDNFDASVERLADAVSSSATQIKITAIRRMNTFLNNVQMQEQKTKQKTSSITM